MWIQNWEMHKNEGMPLLGRKLGIFSTKYKNSLHDIK